MGVCQLQAHLPIARPISEIRRSSEKEVQIRKERGLCYACDDKWNPGHKSKKKDLSVLLIGDDDDDVTVEMVVAHNAIDHKEKEKTEVQHWRFASILSWVLQAQRH